jgi:hypothetical protein
VTGGFVGCLRNFRLKNKRIGKWSQNNRGGVKPCSEKVESGTFIGPGGGFIHAFKKFRVGLDFDVTMKIKPRNVTGLLLAIKGRKDFMILQMVDGAMTFTVNNGRGPIVAIFTPSYKFTFCDGRWHEIHGKKRRLHISPLLSLISSFQFNSCKSQERCHSVGGRHICSAGHWCSWCLFDRHQPWPVHWRTPETRAVDGSGDRRCPFCGLHQGHCHREGTLQDRAVHAQG